MLHWPCWFAFYGTIIQYCTGCTRHCFIIRWWSLSKVFHVCFTFITFLYSLLFLAPHSIWVGDLLDWHGRHTWTTLTASPQGRLLLVTLVVEGARKIFAVIWRTPMIQVEFGICKGDNLHCLLYCFARVFSLVSTYFVLHTQVALQVYVIFLRFCIWKKNSILKHFCVFSCY